VSKGRLTDAEGDDRREDTGEPVETNEGWVFPSSRTSGPGNEAGGGEWPSRARPPAPPLASDRTAGRRGARDRHET
jgi:hypothetical protein